MSDELPSGDVVELGGRRLLPPGWRPSRGAVVLAAATLVIGLAAGYAAGDRHARAAAPRPEPSAAPAPSVPQPAGLVPAATFSFADSPPLTQGTGACSAQAGRDLQLGVQVTNNATVPLILTTVRAVVSGGALRQVAGRWGPCGTLLGQPSQPSQPGAADEVLQPGASTWLTVTFRVKVRCPSPYPVRFTVGYLTGGRPATISLSGFPDLGRVPYRGCPAGDVWVAAGS